MKPRTTALIGVLVLCTACSASTSSAPRTNLARIEAHEIRQTGYSDAFSLVQALRPHWLSTRGATSFGATAPVRVYLDGSRLGGVGELRQIPTRSLESLAFLDGVQAAQVYGLDHGNGAIVASSTTNTARR